MEQNKKTGLINWMVLLMATVATIVVSRLVNSTAGLMSSVLLGIGLLTALVSYFQMRLEERERVEKLEFDELNKTKGSSALFSGDADTFTAQRSREQFERFFVPAFTVILLVIEVGAIFWHWNYLEKEVKPLVATRTLLAASLF